MRRRLGGGFMGGAAHPPSWFVRAGHGPFADNGVGVSEGTLALRVKGATCAFRKVGFSGT